MDNMAKIREAQIDELISIGAGFEAGAYSQHLARESMRKALALLAEDKPSVPMAMLTPLVNGNIWTSEDIRVHVESFGYAMKE